MEKQDTIKELRELYHEFGSADYIGEPLSIVAHSLQAAFHAQQDGQDSEMVLGCLFHDIGHIIAISDEKKGIKVVENMAGCGAKDHEHIGADFLKARGFTNKVCGIVRGHVNAKRYLCWKD